MPTMNISLPEPMKEFVEEEVSTGSYGSVSEYIRTLVREAQERKINEKLERLLIEGMNSGDGKEITSEFLSDLQRSVSARVAAHKKKHSAK